MSEDPPWITKATMRQAVKFLGISDLPMYAVDETLGMKRELGKGLRRFEAGGVDFDSYRPHDHVHGNDNPAACCSPLDYTGYT